MSTILATHESLYAHLTAAGNPVLTAGVAADDVTPERLGSGFANDRPAVVYTRNTGAPDPDLGSLDVATFSFRCYGGSADPADALRVATGVVQRLHEQFNVGAGAGRIVRSMVGSVSDSEDPDFDPPAPIVVVVAEFSAQ